MVAAWALSNANAGVLDSHLQLPRIHCYTTTGVQCNEASADGTSGYVDRYEKHIVLVGVFAALYSFGVPLFFFFLVNKFKKHGKGGDQVVRGALGWMYEPFRSGREWW